MCSSDEMLEINDIHGYSFVILFTMLDVVSVELSSTTTTLLGSKDWFINDLSV